MTGLIDGILILSLMIGVVGLIYLIFLIVKLSYENFEEEEKKENRRDAAMARKSIAPGMASPGTQKRTGMDQKQIREPEYIEADLDSEKTVLLSAGTIGYFPYASLKFKVLAGEKSHREEFLIREKTSIGRSDFEDIHLEDKLVSRHHADILFKNNEIYLIDCGSVNGTMVNGVKIKAQSVILIPSGSCVQIGNTVFLVEKLKKLRSD